MRSRPMIVIPVWVLTLTLFVLHGYLGVGYLVTPPNAQLPSSLSYAVEIATMNTWGLMFAIGSLLTFVGAAAQNRLGSLANVVAALPLIVFTPAVFLAEHDGTANRFGSAVLFLVPIVLHGVMAWHNWRRRVLA